MFDKAQGHGAVHGAAHRRSRSGRDHGRPLHLHADVRDRRVVDQRRHHQRSAHVAEGVRQPAAVDCCIPGAHVRAARRRPTTRPSSRPTWPAAQGRAGMLTQPSFLWSASDPALTSIVKRGKFIHDDIVCQDALPPPIDLSTPAGDERDRLQVARRRHHAVDVRQRGAPVRRAHAVRALQELPRADGSLLARRSRTSARSATTAPPTRPAAPIDPSVTFTAGRRWRRRW